MKAAAVALFFGIWLWAYDVVNGFAADPIRTIHLTNPASVFPWVIQPWTAVIYVIGGVIFPVAPFLYYRNWRGIAFVMACFRQARCYRSPSTRRGRCRWSARRLRAHTGRAADALGFRGGQAGKLLPEHARVLRGARGDLIDRAGVGREARWFWWVFAAAVCVTTVTSGQHYFIDVPGGVAVAVAGYTAGHRLVRIDPSQYDL